MNNNYKNNINNSLDSNDSNSSSSSNSSFSEEYQSILINYLIESRKGFDFIISKDFQKAFECYSICHNLSSKLKNKKLIIDSYINLSNCYYYLGDFNSALKNMIISKKFFDDLNMKKKLFFLVKIYSNLFIINLSCCKFNECENVIKEFININKKIKDNNEKILIYNKIIYNLFKVDSLIEFNNNINNNNNNDNLIIFDIINGYNNFINNNNNYEYLIELFSNIEKKYKNNKNNFDYYFALFYKNVLIYINNIENDNNDENKKIINNIENIKKNFFVNNNNNNKIKEKKIDEIINEFKNKIECSIKIFNLLLKYEQEINKNLNKKQSNSIYIKLLINYSINFIKNNNNFNNNNNKKERNSLLNELEIINKKIKNFQIDIENIDIKNNFSIEIINSLKKLFENVIFILQKNLLSKTFQKIKNKHLNIVKKSKTNEIFHNNNKKNNIENLFKEATKNIQKIIELKKINFGNKSLKTHYYNINFETKNFQIRKNKNDNKIIEHKLKKIIKILNGIYSENLKKKLLNDNQSDENVKKILKKHSQILSFIINNRSIDLYFNKEDDIKNWFYGLYYYYYNNNMSFKILSCTNFVLRRLKFKIIKKIDKISKNDDDIINNNKKIFKNLNKKNSIQKFTFTNLILFLNNLVELNNL